MKAFDCYCAFCRNPRRLRGKKRAGFFNALQAFGIAILLSLAIWREINAKLLVIFGITFMVIDAVMALRSRVELVCPHCGFDPALYVRNKVAACDGVKRHLETRQSDPDVWLARKPPISLPKRSKNKNTTREIVV